MAAEAKQITRYELPLTGHDGSAAAVMAFPAGSTVLECRELYGRHPCLWVLEPIVPPADGAQEKLRITLFGTGVRIPDSDTLGSYIGSAQVAGGDQVVHVFAAPVAAEVPVTEPTRPGNGSGNDASNPPSPGPERGGQDSTPGNSQPSAPPAGSVPPVDPTIPPAAPPDAPPAGEIPPPGAGTDPSGK